MASFLCKFHGDLSPEGKRIPAISSDWEGGTVNVRPPTRSTAGKGTKSPMILQGDRVYLWVHDVEPGSLGAGLTAKARVSRVDVIGVDHVDIRIEHVELLNPVKFHQFDNNAQISSNVWRTLILGHRQTLHIAENDINEWEAHYEWYAEQVAEANVRKLAPELSNENLERFQSAVARPGQGEFRVSVMERHESQCAVTGESLCQVLDAAHVLSFAKHKKKRNDPRNGILLRVDIHRLFDSGLISIDGRILVLSEKLRGSKYEIFRDLCVKTSASPSYLAQHHLDSTSAQEKY